MAEKRVFLPFIPHSSKPGSQPKAIGKPAAGRPKISTLMGAMAILLTCTLSSKITASEPINPSASECLNAIVSLETNDWNDAMTKQISDAIAQKIPIICCTSLLGQLLKTDPRPHLLSDNDDWTVFTTDSGDISVCIPLGHKDAADAHKILAEFGLDNLKHVPDIPSGNIMKMIESAVAPTDPQLLMEHFDKLFIKHQKENPVAKKHFFVIGHGRTGAHIAGIPISTADEKKPLHTICKNN